MKYTLRLQIAIQATTDDGYPAGNMGNLQVTEDVQFTADSFMEIASILGQFHDLAKAVKIGQGPRNV